MKISRYEIDYNRAFKQLMIAVNEIEDTIEPQEYIIVERNETEDYTVAIENTHDGTLADICFEIDISGAECSAKANIGDRYVVILAKYLGNGQYCIIKENNIVK